MSAPDRQSTGMPRWLVWAIAGKLVLIAAIVAGVVWWSSR